MPQVTNLATAVESGSELVTRARRGDVGAFEALYREHVGRVYGLCLRMTGQPDSAEDLTQDTFVNAWRSLAGYEGRSEVSMTDDAGEQMEFEAEAAMDEATPIDIERAIAALPPGARDIVVLHGIYGYSHEEAAGMLGVAVGTCKAQLHRARHLMRARMGGEEAR
jgi:RNA polymerase sigma-70 factor (ECF subfamily)